MHSHPNAHLTPRGRAQVFQAVEAGMTVTAACLASRVSRRWYYRWRPELTSKLVETAAEVPAEPGMNTA